MCFRTTLGLARVWGRVCVCVCVCVCVWGGGGGGGIANDDSPSGPFTNTWFNFNPSMDK